MEKWIECARGMFLFFYALLFLIRYVGWFGLLSTHPCVRGKSGSVPLANIDSRNAATVSAAPDELTFWSSVRLGFTRVGRVLKFKWKSRFCGKFLVLFRTKTVWSCLLCLRCRTLIPNYLVFWSIFSSTATSVPFALWFVHYCTVQYCTAKYSCLEEHGGLNGVVCLIFGTRGFYCTVGVWMFGNTGVLLWG